MQNGEVTAESIADAMATVRRMLENAEFDSALRLSEWCVVHANELEDPIMKARIMVTRGIALARVNDHADAIPYYDKALQLYEDAGDEVFAAKVRMNRVLSYSHLARYEEALIDARISDEVFTRLDEKFLLAMNCNNLGEVLFRLDRFQEWLATLKRSEELLREIGDRKSLAMVFMNRAVVFTSLNDPSQAFHHYKLSKELAEETGQTYLSAQCNYNLGYLHYVQGEYTKALNALDDTRAALPNHQWFSPLCDLTQSEIYLEMNMCREAIHLAESAYTVFESAQKPFEMAKAVGVMAVARGQLGEFQAAAKLFDQAKTMFESQGNRVRAATMDLYRSVLWLQVGRYSEAKTIAHEAYEAFMKEDVKPKASYARIVEARAGLKLDYFESASRDATEAASLHDASPAHWVGHQLHGLLGEIHSARGDSLRARYEFRIAIDELEGIRANIAADELRLNYLKDKVPVYELLLKTTLQLGDEASLREAFETAERAKSRTLVDLLAGSIESLRDVRWSSVEEIQDTLPSDAALLEYVVTGDRVIAFCLSRTKFEVVSELCSRTELKKRFDFLQFHLSRISADPAVAQQRASLALLNIQDHLHKLYLMLVQPLERLFADIESLIFVPSDFLHYLPFHALFDGESYLMDRFTISYAPAASIYRLFKAKQADVTGSPLLIGVADARAPFIADEIENIYSVLPSARRITAADATRSRVTDEMASASLIHIASHATFRPDSPMFSSIQLHDGPLNFFDLYTLRTSASLITLSGCGTGLSHVVAGDELLGLVRGFLYAGATSVVTSLWDVNDRTAADLMKHFYTHLAEGQSKGESLRRAMLRLKQEHPHPYYWAPFLLMGNPN